MVTVQDILSTVTSTNDQTCHKTPFATVKSRGLWEMWSDSNAGVRNVDYHSIHHVSFATAKMKENPLIYYSRECHVNIVYVAHLTNEQ